ncbi:HAMP domain-containing sensor histidine kinase [Paenibacillus sp. GYB004]|uniref:sensor histidine kinase n=1 Tax=Paenibacillus sp. GYB004 TaxID=2994393 RepID=UPI002F963A3D
MRTLRIRTITMLILVVILLVPWIFYVTVYFMENLTLRLGKDRLQDEMVQAQLNEIVRLIETGSGQWGDPGWQGQLIARLQTAKMEADLISASGEELFRSDPVRSGGAFTLTEQFSFIEDGWLRGKAVVYVPKSNTVPVLSMFAGLFLIFIIVGVVMRRVLLKPLERMSFAARQIAAGDWEVKLPRSRITEISEVRDGFEVMVNGLRQAFDKQTELEEKRRFVIAAVAHDLRTPLFALRGYLDGLEQGVAQSVEKAAKYVAVCKEKSAQLDRLVEDLFTYTKLEYPEMKLHCRTIDFKTFIQKSIDSVSPLARLKQISIANQTADGCTLSGDMHLLERALDNLLDNAVRYTPANGEIVIQCYTENDKMKFTFRDTGPGFSSEDLQRVFEPLYRGETSRNRSTGGSGLGLTISHTIMKRHGGGLAVSNHPEGGALVTGWLPVNGQG